MSKTGEDSIYACRTQEGTEGRTRRAEGWTEVMVLQTESDGKVHRP